MITTVRDAESAVGFWRRRCQALERSTYSIGLKADPVDLSQHLSDLQAARVAHRRALEELATVRREKPLRGSVRLLTAPVQADRRVPVIGTAELRRLIQMERVGIKPTPRRVVWAPANQREADELMRTFGISETKSAGIRRRGFSVERLR